MLSPQSLWQEVPPGQCIALFDAILFIKSNSLAKRHKFLLLYSLFVISH